jgi:CHASE3 domain sensor protein
MQITQLIAKLRNNFNKLKQELLAKTQLVNNLTQENKELKQQLVKLKNNNNEIANELSETIKELDIYLERNHAES